ncbi:partial cobalt-precorrin-6B (C15)-methyltransferase, partial [Anaerolineae bacterium]
MNPKYLLDAYEIAPKKSLGQNFLQDAHILGKIVAAAELKPGDTVLEIGAGTGALTVALAQTHAQVVALEIDDRLLPILQRQLGDFPNVEIVQGDIEEVDPVALVGGGEYTVVANLPYYITSKI